MVHCALFMHPTACTLTMHIAEVYCSLQGEGLLTGTPSVFIRASGCNLRCWFCDTPYTSWQPEGEDWSVEEIVEEVERLAAAPTIPSPLGASSSRSRPGEGFHPRTSLDTLPRALSHVEQLVRHVVITGGEPMLFAEMLPLCEKLSAAALHITIETAGTLFLPVACDLMSISPKLA